MPACSEGLNHIHLVEQISMVQRFAVDYTHGMNQKLTRHKGQGKGGNKNSKNTTVYTSFKICHGPF